MAYNHAKEEMMFKEKWEKNERRYREIGMTDEQIASIKEFDSRVFKLDRAFYRRTILLPEPEELSSGTTDTHSDTYLEYYWVELIDSTEKYQRLMDVPRVMLRAFYMYRALGMCQDDISSKLSIPQRTVSYWIGKIAEILK
ncbi:MAG: hypothetical protein IKW90_16765 [Lachnospiraceae bacterium]|nr:hypothetical protein [Lachnospiraceae bacterium]